MQNQNIMKITKIDFEKYPKIVVEIFWKKNMT